jgi:sporulation protein YlmC with PRC-barrel domain
VSMDSQFARGDGARSHALVDERSSSGDELLHLPVCVDGAELGRPTDLLVDLDRLRVVGLNVRCDQGAERFLPLAAAELAAERINASSSLALLDESAYYGEHGASLRSLRGASVDLAGRRVGTLTDIVLRSDGEVTRIVVKGESGKLRRLGAKHVRIGQRKAAR